MWYQDEFRERFKRYSSLHLLRTMKRMQFDSTTYTVGCTEFIL